MGAVYQIDKLDSSNFESWKTHMKSVLVQSDHWKIVNGTTTKTAANEANFADLDQKALASITLNVKASQLVHIKNCKTSNEAWLKLEKLYEHKGPARKVSLFKKLLHTKASETHSIKEHVETFMDVVEKLQELKITIQEEVITIILLCSLPSSFENFVVAIESRDELPKLDSLYTKILEEDQRRGNKELQGNGENNENAFYTSYKKRISDKVKIKCYSCGKHGHKSFQCKNKKNPNYRKIRAGFRKY